MPSQGLLSPYTDSGIFHGAYSWIRDISEFYSYKLPWRPCSVLDEVVFLLNDSNSQQYD